MVRGDARLVSDASSVTATTGVRYVLDGPYQQALGQAQWHLSGLWNGYGRFRTDDLAPPVRVTGAPGATVTRVSTTEWGTETDVVDTPGPATVIRSEAYLPGWQVAARPVGGGATRTLRVFEVGLVQAVRVPPGRWTLTFSYWPSGLSLGGIASAVGVVAVFWCAAVGLRRRRRRAAPPAASADR